MNTLSRATTKILPIVLGAILLFLVASITACSGSSGNTQSNSLIEPTWIQAELTDNSVSISLSEVETNVMSHFTVNTSSGEMDFMAYELSGETYVRASICPPCYSRSFALKGDTLVCDTCGTVFDAETGSGIKGACVNFPKASVSYEVDGNSIVMGVDDLLTAYDNTLELGLS
ncbi:MAG: Fe-S-containing protein [Dehalococcoidia bacterium]|jgi:nitrite reductase/ring-hydroxylating ferredoxin subunit